MNCQKKNNEIWEKLRNSIKKEFDSEPVYNEKYLKTKTESQKGKINTNFHNKKLPEEGFTYLFIINFHQFCFQNK